MMNENDKNDLQNVFTAYLNTALKRRRRDYMKALNKVREHERPLEEWQNITHLEESDLDAGLPAVEQVHNDKLVLTLRKFNEQTSQVLYMRIFEDMPFELISQRLGITYNMARNIYYRSVEIIKKEVLNNE